MRQAAILVELQETDNRLRQHQARLKEIAIALANDRAVKAAQRQVDAAVDQLAPHTKMLKDLELQRDQTQRKREQTEQRLYSGTVKNPKELQDMQQEIESLKRWLSELEDRMLESMVNVDDKQAILDDAQQALDDAMTAAAERQSDLLDERERLQSEVSQLESQRESRYTDLTDDNQALYSRLAPKKGYKPIAQLTSEGSCSICGIQQTATIAQAVKRSDETQYCRSCGRVLVYLS